MKDNRQKFEKSIDTALRMDISGDTYEKNTPQGLEKRISDLELRLIAAEERINKLEHHGTNTTKINITGNASEITKNLKGLFKSPEFEEDGFCARLNKMLKDQQQSTHPEDWASGLID